MTATVTERPATGAATYGPFVRGAIGLVDGGVVAFAWFTVLAHLWDIANGRVVALLLTWLVTLPLPMLVLWRLKPPPVTATDARPGWLRSVARWGRPGRPAVLALVVLALLGGVLLAVPRRGVWRLGWAVVLVVVLLAVAALVLRRPDAGADGEEQDADPGHRRAVAQALLLALVAGLGLLAFSLFTVSPSGDDAYYVNRVAWIAQHGTIPDRDTMFGNNVFSPLYSPAIGTFETFAGGLGHLFHLSGPTVDYLVLGPLLAGVLPVLLWRAMVALRLRRPLLGMVAALAFLTLTARGPQWFGTMVLNRPWQTKEIFAAAMVPLLYGYGAIVARRGGWRPGALLVAGTIAAIGLSSSAAGLAPVVLVAIGIAGYLVRGPRMLPPVLVAIGYPVACLVAYRLSGSSQAFATTNTAHYKVPYDIWEWFVGTGIAGLVAALAIGVGFFGARERAAQLMLGIGSLGVLVALAPGFLDKAGPLLGGAPTAWRVIWVAPLPLLVAGAASAVDVAAARFGRVVVRYAAAAVTAAAVVALVLFETPLTSSPEVSFSGKPRWDVKVAALQAARRLVALAPKGSVVAGPTDVAGAVAFATSWTYSLNARAYYAWLIAAEAGPAFRQPQRVQLTRWLGGSGSPLAPAAAARELRAWPVAAVCLAQQQPSSRLLHRNQALLAAGYRAAGRDRTCRYFAAPRA